MRRLFWYHHKGTCTQYMFNFVDIVYTLTTYKIKILFHGSMLMNFYNFTCLQFAKRNLGYRIACCIATHQYFLGTTAVRSLNGA